MKLLTAFLPVIIIGCKTTNPASYVYPPRPQRETIITNPKTPQEYALVIAYYEYLVEEWEAWADIVEHK